MSLWLTNLTFSFIVALLMITNNQKHFFPFILVSLEQKKKINKKSFAFRVFPISENNFFLFLLGIGFHSNYYC